MDVYKTVEGLCAERGITCRQMAKDIGISVSTPNDWKNRNTKPTYRTALKLAEYFQVPMSCFWEKCR